MDQRGKGRITIAAATLGLGLAVCLPATVPAQAEQAMAATERTAADRLTDISSQERPRRAPRRLPIYPRDNGDGVIPRYDPGPNAVRDCTATYVQEYRPSGTVIVPRMNCFWRRG
ncbi:hypothetical protein BJ123_13935 [Rhodopseudomonas thermotolerans]|uniref:Uncharacterized protein n=2 Tax=Rhodopseudomonas TaxID=1073 RepID=A0A336K0P0_9BRAD|nr:MULTISPECIES: hypothetical protein [Rhodopseudomonas]RED22962.1 hypothetical protein BJ125_13935 [Rhodopseudomonas pentothenatexigens]REF88792.1 hypothetical protein BJ123_13935 [Rhodopseudomonas thermotolerans]SSW93474.1 hypothetical protein SAMN05892882_13935 [Rhodopseudomonas pentothenatexigens]